MAGPAGKGRFETLLGRRLGSHRFLRTSRPLISTFPSSLNWRRRIVLARGRRLLAFDRLRPARVPAERPSHSLIPYSQNLSIPRYIMRSVAAMERGMLVVTTENVAGHRVVEVKGQCFGVVVRSRGLGGNVMAGLRSLVGGEIHEYTHLLEETRRQAVDRLVQNATVMGANAVLMMRFDSSEIGQTMSEIVAYGTAAVIEPLPR